MMHSACIAAFRTRPRHRTALTRTLAARPGKPGAPRLTAMADGDTHQCVQRQASSTAVPAFYTLCGCLVPAGNVSRTCATVTCPDCRQQAEPGSKH